MRRRSPPPTLVQSRLALPTLASVKASVKASVEGSDFLRAASDFASLLSWGFGIPDDSIFDLSSIPPTWAA